jgi:hypothetical protein
VTFGPHRDSNATAPRLQVIMTMREQLNSLTEQIIGAALAVHRELGPGMLEKLVINFNVQWLVRDGIRRIVNDFPESR